MKAFYNETDKTWGKVMDGEVLPTTLPTLFADTSQEVYVKGMRVHTNGYKLVPVTIAMVKESKEEAVKETT